MEVLDRLRDDEVALAGGVRIALVGIEGGRTLLRIECEDGSPIRLTPPQRVRNVEHLDAGPRLVPDEND